MANELSAAEYLAWRKPPRQIIYDMTGGFGGLVAVSSSTTLADCLGKVNSMLGLLKERGLIVEADPSTEHDPDNDEYELDDGVDAERQRVLLLLDQIKPPEEPYTRKEWAWEQKGAKAMWEKVRALVESGEAPKAMGD